MNKSILMFPNCFFWGQFSPCLWSMYLNSYNMFGLPETFKIFSNASTWWTPMLCVETYERVMRNFNLGAARPTTGLQICFGQIWSKSVWLSLLWTEFTLSGQLEKIANTYDVDAISTCCCSFYAVRHIKQHTKTVLAVFTRTDMHILLSAIAAKVAYPKLWPWNIYKYDSWAFSSE